MHDELIPEVLTAHRAGAAAGDAAEGFLLHVQRFAAFNPQLGVWTVQAHLKLLAIHAEGFINVQQDCLAIGVQYLAVQRAHALELVGGIQLAARFRQALVDHVLHSLQLTAGTEGANTLDLVGLDGEAFGQVHGVERNQLTLGRTDHQARSPTLTRRHQGQGVAVFLDLHGQRADALFAEQAQAADAARQVFLVIDCSGQRGDAECIVFKNGDIGHGVLSRNENPAHGGMDKRG